MILARAANRNFLWGKPFETRIINAYMIFMQRQADAFVQRMPLDFCRMETS